METELCYAIIALIFASLIIRGLLKKSPYIGLIVNIAAEEDTEKATYEIRQFVKSIPMHFTPFIGMEIKHPSFIEKLEVVKVIAFENRSLNVICKGIRFPKSSIEKIADQLIKDGWSEIV